MTCETNDIVHTQDGIFLSLVDNNTTQPSASAEGWKVWLDKAPFNDREFSRVLKDDGVLYSVIPGENHLIEMKELLYDVPYRNDEKAPDSEILQLVEREKVSEKVHISNDDLYELFSMTPYFYRTSEENKKRLDGVGDTALTVDFVMLPELAGGGMRNPM